MAVGQNQWYHFGVGAPPILVYSSGDLDIHWGYGFLTHGHMSTLSMPPFASLSLRYGIKDKDVTMCVTESGRQDGHAWATWAKEGHPWKACFAFVWIAG